MNLDLSCNICALFYPMTINNDYLSLHGYFEEFTRLLEEKGWDTQEILCPECTNAQRISDKLAYTGDNYYRIGKDQ